MVNKLGKELQGHYVMVTGERFNKLGVLDLVFVCEGGFGCNPTGHGRKIVGTFVTTGRKESLDSQTEIEREAMEPEIQAAKEVRQKKDDEVDEVEYPCGCLVSKSLGDEGIWHVSLFCDEHDPTVKHGG